MITLEAASAETYVIKHVQAVHFTEVHAIKAEHPVPANSCLLALRPVVDSPGGWLI